MTWYRSHHAAIRKAAIVIFFLLVATLLGIAIAWTDWAEVMRAIRKMPAAALWMGAAITAASYGVYCTFDLLGKWYTDHSLQWLHTMKIAFISYAFTMNLGAPVGGVGLRLRMYTREGVQQGIVLRVFGLSLTTNWIGYSLLAGAIFAMERVRIPWSWDLDYGALRIIGVIMVCVGVGYMLLCAFSRTRSWTLKGHEIELPSTGMAAAQVGLAILNWMLIAAVIYVLLQERADYFTVLGILLISAIAGAIAHVPGGLGVTESVFIAFLAPDLPRSEVLGAMVVFRALYYLAPLLIAAVWYLAIEARARKSPPADSADSEIKYTS